ncbi:FOG: Low-complexity [Ceraceosorus bombacis]|uniref:FOG: Low-complexity n=1 Tax=Ceraceosorus bombacis TaxID=401625 RepID=A0A0P1B9A1_9BASI|nr:FOG: Low-complexity [Ceraceosorus bombacis]
MSDSYVFTVGKLDAGMAILIGDRASLIEFPSLLLPPDVTSGSIVNISVKRNKQEERQRNDDFDQLQQDILSTFGLHSPESPRLRIRNVTQTSVTLEWDKLSLASATLLSLDIYRSDRWTPMSRRLAAIPNPLHNTSTKLSGLDVDAEYGFHLVLQTTAGTYASQPVKVKTHKMTDTHGIAVCFGNVADSQLEEAAKEQLKVMGARWTEKIAIDTTHFVCSDPRNRGAASEGRTGPAHGTMYLKATQLSIPVVQPHWIFACAEQKRMVPISSFYLDQEPPNGHAVRDSISRRRQSQSASSELADGAREGPRAEPATPQTASTDVTTPGGIPNIDASLAAASLPPIAVAEQGTVDGDALNEEDLKTPPAPAPKDLPLADNAEPLDDRRTDEGSTGRHAAATEAHALEPSTSSSSGFSDVNLNSPARGEDEEEVDLS